MTAQNDEFDIQLTDDLRNSRLGARRIDNAEVSRDIAGEPSRVTRRKMKAPSSAAYDNTSSRNISPDDISSREPRKPMPPAPQSGIAGFLRDRRLHIFVGLACLIIGGVMAIMLVSHLRHGGADQSRAANLTIEQMVVDAKPVENAGGSFGAWLSHALFTETLGLGSLAIAFYLLILGYNILRRRKPEFWSLTFKTLLVSISTSVVLGLICYTAGTEINWGGTHGHYLNETLLQMGGPILAIAVSAMLISALVAVYLNDIVRLYHRWEERREARRQAAYEMEMEHEAQLKAAIEARRANAKSMPDDMQTVNDINAADLSVNDRFETDSPAIDGDNEDASDNKTADTATDSMSESDNSNADEDDLLDDDPDPEFTDNTDSTLQHNEADNGFTIDDGIKDNVKKALDEGFAIETQEYETLDNGDALADNTPYDHRADLSRYKFPTLDLLDEIPLRKTVDVEEQQQNKDRIIKALADHKVTISSIKATVGPTVTLFEIIPTEGTRIAQIKRLEDDIAMSLKARGIRIIAPMPGKGTIGIEVPNNDPQTVSMRQVLSSKKFRDCNKALPVALGATISNDIFVADLASMPHVLVAGATGQGKSVGLNAIIASLLYKKHPTELKFVLIDPKEVEFSLYAKLENHYLAALPDMEGDSAIITSSDRVLMALNSLCVLMDQRYAMLRKAGVRNITEYNTKFTARKLNPENGHEYMPYIVVIIDEFADLIMTAGKEIELPVTRITQKARAVGIHMVIATQRPSTNVLTGLIKANCPTRIAFRVMQMVDSRTILDRPGANQLIGRGDMLYSSGGEVERMQCAFISTEEVEKLCDFVGEQIGFERPYLLPEPKLSSDEETMYSGFSHATAGGMERDPLFDEAARFIIQQANGSGSMLQRRYQIGYNRAGKIIDQMEAAGILGPASGNKPRQILVDAMQLERILENRIQ